MGGGDKSMYLVTNSYLNLLGYDEPYGPHEKINSSKWQNNSLKAQIQQLWFWEDDRSGNKNFSEEEGGKEREPVQCACRWDSLNFMKTINSCTEQKNCRVTSKYSENKSEGNRQMLILNPRFKKKTIWHYLRFATGGSLVWRGGSIREVIRFWLGETFD